MSGSLIVRDATYLVIGLISCAYASFDFADTISLPITTFGELVAFCTDSAGRQHSSRHERERLHRTRDEVPQHAKADELSTPPAPLSPMPRPFERGDLLENDLRARGLLD